MQTVVIVVHLLIVLALIGVVLLQRSEGGGLGIGGGGGLMNSRGTANMLTRATAILATGFFLTSLTLSILAGWRPATPSIIGPAQTPAQNQQGPAPINPNAPSILDQLQKQQPKGPQVPQSQ